MAHEIEGNNAFYGGNVPAWHGLGTVIPEEVVTTREAIVLAGLDWMVEKQPVMFQLPDGSMMEIPRQYATVRSSDHKPFGVVGERYEPFNNIDAFSFGDKLVADSGAKWHTAGSLFGGAKTWMLMKLPQDVKLSGEESELIEPYICFRNSHDGTSAISAFITPVRVVCQNTLSWAMKGTPRKVNIRHTGRAGEYVLQAQEALGLTFDLMAQLEREGAEMMEAKFSLRRFETMMEKLIPTPKREDSKTDTIHTRVMTKREKRVDTFRDYFTGSPNLQNVQGTKWAALQAVSEVTDHRASQYQQMHDPRETRFERIVEGDAGQRIVQAAYDYLAAA